MQRKQWPKQARDIAAQVESALAAALTAERGTFDDALTTRARADRAQVSTLLGTATLDLLERAHPDGLDAEAAENLLAATVRAAQPWFAEVDDDLLLQAMTGALGIGGHEDAPRAEPDAVLAHGLLLMAELTQAAGTAPAAAVDAAMAELIRAQTVEMP